MWVRRAVAANQSAVRRTLRRLVRDGQPVVRAGAVANPSLPTKHARTRCGDESGSVRYALAARRDLSLYRLSWIERIARRDGLRQYALTCQRIASHPACTAGLRERMASVDSRLRTVDTGLKPLSRRQGYVASVGVGLFMVFAALTVVGVSKLDQGESSGGVLVAIGLLVTLGVVAALLEAWRRSRSASRVWKPPFPIRAFRWGAVVFLTAGALAAHRPGLIALPLVLFLVRAFAVAKNKQKARAG